MSEAKVRPVGGACPECHIGIALHAVSCSKFAGLSADVKATIIQNQIGMSINIMAGLYEGKMDFKTYGPMFRQEALLGDLVGSLVKLIVEEQKR